MVEHLNEEEKRCEESIAEFKDTMRAGENLAENKFFVDKLDDDFSHISSK